MRSGSWKVEIRLMSIWYFSTSYLFMALLVIQVSARQAAGFLAGSAFFGMPMPQPPWIARGVWPGAAGTGAVPVLSATMELSGLKIGPAIVAQKIICAILPLENPSTFSAKP